MCLFSAWHNAALISTPARGCCTHNRAEMNLLAGGGEVTGCLASARPGGTGVGCGASAASLQDRAPGGCTPTKQEEFPGSIPATLGNCTASTSSCLGSWFRNLHGYFLGVTVANQ